MPLRPSAATRAHRVAPTPSSTPCNLQSAPAASKKKYVSSRKIASVTRVTWKPTAPRSPRSPRQKTERPPVGGEPKHRDWHSVTSSSRPGTAARPYERGRCPSEDLRAADGYLAD